LKPDPGPQSRLKEKGERIQGNDNTQQLGTDAQNNGTSATMTATYTKHPFGY